MKRVINVIAVAIVMTFLGAGLAQAYSFGATTVSHDGSQRGAGKGSFYPVGWDGIRLEPTLKDLKKDDMQTYIEGKAMRATQLAVKVQSGRRGDGKDWWVTLSTRTAYAGASTGSAFTEVKVCMDRAWKKDPCKVSADRQW